MNGADVRAALRAQREIALVDVREEDPFAQEHALWLNERNIEDTDTTMEALRRERRLLGPEQAELRDALVGFAGCMRGAGVDMPDPKMGPDGSPILYGPDGMIEHLTVTDPAFLDEGTFAIVVVELEEGVRVVGNTVGIAHDDLRIGLPVRIALDRRKQGWHDKIARSVVIREAG